MINIDEAYTNIIINHNKKSKKFEKAITKLSEQLSESNTTCPRYALTKSVFGEDWPKCEKCSTHCSLWGDCWKKWSLL